MADLGQVQALMGMVGWVTERGDRRHVEIQALLHEVLTQPTDLVGFIRQ